MKKYIVGISIIIIVAISIFGFADIMMGINLFAKGAVLMDEESGEILYSKNRAKRLYPASTTKVLTALLVLENVDIDSIVAIGDEVKLVPGDSSMAGIEVGENYSVWDLLMGLMLVSGNDAANSLAVYTARQVSGQGEDMGIEEAIDYFVGLMNDRAEGLGAENTHFVNPHGYHHPDHYTTALDMALITREALRHPEMRTMGSTDRYEVGGLEWTSTNYMVVPGSNGYYEPTTGLKTGHTSQAKYCLVTTAVKGDRELISVIFKSDSRGRWKDARALMEYGFGDKTINTYKAQVIGERLREILTLNVLDTDIEL